MRWGQARSERGWGEATEAPAAGGKQPASAGKRGIERGEGTSTVGLSRGGMGLVRLPTAPLCH